MLQREIELPDRFDTAALFGSFDENIKTLEKAMGTRIAVASNALRISGDEDGVEETDKVIDILIMLIHSGV